MTKSATVHDIDGTYRADRHDEKADNEQANSDQMPASSPVKPTVVKGKAVKIWKRYVELLPWLTEVDSYALGQYCMLAAEWEKNPDVFVAAKLQQMRKLEADLGMTVVSRGKFSVTPPKGGANKYFDD